MYLVIETHGGYEYATICTNEDGENEAFETKKEAEKYASNCQEGIVINL